MIGDSLTSQQLERLRRLVGAFYSIDDLEELCLTLGLDHETLAGKNPTKNYLIRALISEVERQSRLPELIDRLEKERPNVRWGKELALASDNSAVSRIRSSGDAGYTAGQFLKPGPVSIGSSTQPADKRSQWIVVLSKGTRFLEQAALSGQTFPRKEIQNSKNDGYYVTSVAFGGGNWAVIMSKGTGFTDQRYLGGSMFPHSSINRRRSQRYLVTQLAYGRNEWLAVVSKNSGFSDQVCSLRKEFPEARIRTMEKRRRLRLTSLAYGGGYWAVSMSKGSGYGRHAWWQTTFDKARKEEYVEKKWNIGYRITNLVFGDEGLWAVMLTTGSPYVDQTWMTMDKMSNKNLARAWSEGWRVTEIGFGPL